MCLVLAQVASLLLYICFALCSRCILLPRVSVRLLRGKNASIGFIGSHLIHGQIYDHPSVSKSPVYTSILYNISPARQRDCISLKDEVKVRFAPSPTGDLHVGNLRTFIYNYLYARKHGGKLILRVDDTDENRQISGSLENTINDLKWLGFTWSEGPGGERNQVAYYQSKQHDAYRKIVDFMILGNKAYRCFCTKEEIKLQKLKAKETGSRISYPKKCRMLPKEKVTENLLENKEYTIRFRNDEDEDDFILMRSDGTATYNFACAVDDYNHGITHVIRGVDHLENTSKQVQILNSIGAELPNYVHCSLMINNQGKISKSSSDTVTIARLRQMGICKLPIVNYLSFLGTRYSDDATCRDIGTISQIFDLDLLSKVPISFDMAKLLWVNRRYIADISHGEFLSQISTYLDEVDNRHFSIPKEQLQELINAAPKQMKSGVDTMSDYVALVEHAVSYKLPRFVGPDCYGYGGYFLKPESQKFLETFVEWSLHLISASELGQSLSVLLKDMLRSEEFIAIEGKQHVGVVRYALTGTNHGPPISHMIELWETAEKLGIDAFVPLRQRILNLKKLKHDANDPVAERLFFQEGTNAVTEN